MRIPDTLPEWPPRPDTLPEGSPRLIGDDGELLVDLPVDRGLYVPPSKPEKRDREAADIPTWTDVPWDAPAWTGAWGTEPAREAEVAWSPPVETFWVVGRSHEDAQRFRSLGRLAGAIQAEGLPIPRRGLPLTRYRDGVPPGCLGTLKRLLMGAALGAGLAVAAGALLGAGFSPILAGAGAILGTWLGFKHAVASGTPRELEHGLLTEGFTYQQRADGLFPRNVGPPVAVTG
ncbi:MAG: hypothetical protein AB1758_08050 [Candidatus Eremiobacterota bacterium]